MNWMRFFRRRRANSELEQEMAFYLEEETADNMARGMAEPEARRQAQIKLGNAQKVRESLWTQNSVPRLENLWRDFKYSVRALARNRVVALVAILSIGLGIGSNTTIFSLVSRFVLRPAPVFAPAGHGVFRYGGILWTDPGLDQRGYGARTGVGPGRDHKFLPRGRAADGDGGGLF